MLKYILLLVLIGCGTGRSIVPCTPFEAGGLQVCSEKDVDPEEVRYLVDTVERETYFYYPEVVELDEVLRYYHVTAQFLDVEVLAMDCDETGYDGTYTCDKLISGVNYNGTDILVQYQECLAYTSLAHEILHSVEILYLGKTGDLDDHMTAWLFDEWDIANNTAGNSVETRVRRHLSGILPSCQ